MGIFRAMKPNDETNNANEHNTDKNPNWQEADKLAIYKHDQGVELGSTKNNSSLAVKTGLEPTTSRFQVQCPNHSAALPLGTHFLPHTQA